MAELQSKEERADVMLVGTTHSGYGVSEARTNDELGSTVAAVEEMA